MKIKVNDLKNILKQVRETEQPTTKEHHKLLNTLKIFLEDNTDIQDPAILRAKQEALQTAFHKLSKTRREKPKEIKKEFEEFIKTLKEKINFLQLENKKKEFEIKNQKENKNILMEIKKTTQNVKKLTEKIKSINSNLKENCSTTNNPNKTIIDYFRTL